MLNLIETMVTQLFPKIGQRSVFLKKIEELKDLKVWTPSWIFSFYILKKEGEMFLIYLINLFLGNNV